MLTKRLNCILNYVNCKVAADVGTDHAYIAVELIKSGKAEKVIASDINEGPLNIAKNNIIKEGLSDWAKGQVQLMFANDKLLEMIPISSGKGTALKWLSEYLGVNIENTMAAGDMENDISMLEVAGVGVAMLNGAPQVKEVADMVTVFDNNNDGLVPILEEFFGC